MAANDPLVTAEWLKENIDAPDVRVVDATWFMPSGDAGQTGQKAYQEGHIPGAVFFDIDKIAAPDNPMAHMLPDPILFSSHVRALGIGDGNRIIVYDQNNFFASARAWWMLRVMGHRDVHVLDGGFATWQTAGGTVEDLPPVAVERHFTARVRADLVVDAAQVASLSETRTGTIIDARPAGRFTGESPEPRPDLKSGHIPGSRSVPGSQLLNPDGTMKDADTLTKLFGNLALPIVTSCGSGVTAGVTALALARIGYWDVAVYDGSWSEWAADASRPIATGAA